MVKPNYCPPQAKRVGGILKLFVLESTTNFVKIGSMSGTLGIDQKFRKNRFDVCYTRRYQKLVKIGSMSGTLGDTKNCVKIGSMSATLGGTKNA